MTSPTKVAVSIGDRVLGRQKAAPYRLRMAESKDDLRAAQTLRFLVFNLEMQEGLESSYSTCLDADLFDDVCDHLLVESLATSEIVGTYRLQTGHNALKNLGYYSATEFDMAPFESHRAKMVELGRACVHSAHRNLIVLGLLWRGIAKYARDNRARYLIGCSSIPTQNEQEGAAVYEQLRNRFLAPPEFQTSPLPRMACSLIEQVSTRVKVPKLLSAYLSLGAKICGAPAVDREFHSIDFLTLLDLENLSESIVAKVLA